MKTVNMHKLMAVILPLLILPTVGSAVTGPKLVCDAPVYQFGRVDQSAVVTNVFTVRNEGDTTFIAGLARTTCSCTKARISKRMIGPGETAELTAVFTAVRRSGEQKKTIYLLPYESETPAVTFYLEGFVEPPAQAQ
ncbi:MAG: DUF1573 domain-containing protein [Kiritimatiellales bacterium]|jgi:hypothetical protein